MAFAPFHDLRSATGSGEHLAALCCGRKVDRLQPPLMWLPWNDLMAKET
jgi:hypothetical protein